MIRELKNREAAQTSRDRKKARMEELEKAVKCLERNVRMVRPIALMIALSRLLIITDYRTKN